MLVCAQPHSRLHFCWQLKMLHFFPEGVQRIVLGYDRPWWCYTVGWFYKIRVEVQPPGRPWRCKAVL